MQIEWWTLGLQAINFLILVWLLSRFLYRPVRRVIAERQARSEQALTDAKARAQEAEAARARYEAERAAMEEQRRGLEAEVHRAAQGEAERIAASARDEAAKLVDSARKAAAEERARALAATKRQVAGIASDLAARLLRDSGETGAGAATIRAVGDFFAGLPEERRAELRRTAADGSIEVVTAAPLSDTCRGDWETALHGWLGPEIRESFATDPDLLGGVVLRLPDAELDFTWARELREAEGALLGDRP